VIDPGWTVDTLNAYFQRQLDDLRCLLDERYQTQTTALTAAFAAAERAVQTALLAAKEATNKAELAADKRFDAVNEFRAQLTDQAATFMPRKEADVVLSSLSERVSALTSRIDRSQGKSSGLDKAWALLVAAVVAVGGVVAAVVAITN
jgi:hypothetical protein